MSIPSKLYCITHAAIEFAVATGSAPEVVGTSVEPKADTTIFTPAALYSALIEARSSSVSAAQTSAWSHAPSMSRNDSALQIGQYSIAKSQQGQRGGRGRERTHRTLNPSIDARSGGPVSPETHLSVYTTKCGAAGTSRLDAGAAEANAAHAKTAAAQTRRERRCDTMVLLGVWVLGRALSRSWGTSFYTTPRSQVSLLLARAGESPRRSTRSMCAYSASAMLSL